MQMAVTEYLEIELEKERWRCRRCQRDLGPARDNYKRGLLVHDRDPKEIHQPILHPAPYLYTFAPDSKFCRILQYYCPCCGTQVETQNLPPRHPPTHHTHLHLHDLH